MEPKPSAPISYTESSKVEPKPSAPVSYTQSSKIEPKPSAPINYATLVVPGEDETDPYYPLQTDQPEGETEPQNKLHKGVRILSHFRTRNLKSKRPEPGTVWQVNEDKTIDIKFDDGVGQKQIPRDWVLEVLPPRYAGMAERTVWVDLANRPKFRRYNNNLGLLLDGSSNLVKRVAKGDYAEYLGLKRGDYIVSVNDLPIGPTDGNKLRAAIKINGKMPFRMTFMSRIRVQPVWRDAPQRQVIIVDRRRSSDNGRCTLRNCGRGFVLRCLLLS